MAGSSSWMPYASQGVKRFDDDDDDDNKRRICEIIIQYYGWRLLS